MGGNRGNLPRRVSGVQKLDYVKWGQLYFSVCPGAGYELHDYKGSHYKEVSRGNTWEGYGIAIPHPLRITLIVSLGPSSKLYCGL